jgi:hypothetical protein
VRSLPTEISNTDKIYMYFIVWSQKIPWVCAKPHQRYDLKAIIHQGEIFYPPPSSWQVLGLKACYSLQPVQGLWDAIPITGLTFSWSTIRWKQYQYAFNSWRIVGRIKQRYFTDSNIRNGEEGNKRIFYV